MDDDSAASGEYGFQADEPVVGPSRHEQGGNEGVHDASEQPGETDDLTGWLSILDSVQSSWPLNPEMALDLLVTGVVARKDWLSPTFVGRLNKLSRVLVPGRGEADFRFKYGVLDRLRRWKDDGSAMYALRWTDLLATVANAAHANRRYQVALELQAEAWSFRYRIPESKRLVFMTNVASNFSSAAGFGGTHFAEKASAVTSMLTESLELTQKKYRRPEALGCLLKLVSAEMKLTVRRSKYGELSKLQGAEVIVENFRAAIGDLRWATGKVASTRLPLGEAAIVLAHHVRGRERTELFSVLLNAADAALISGDTELDKACLIAARRCALTPSDEVFIRVWEATRTDDVVLKSRLCEEILRIIDSGAFDRTPKRHQQRVIFLSAKMFSALISLLVKQGMDVLASFWRLQRLSIRKRHHRFQDDSASDLQEDGSSDDDDTLDLDTQEGLEAPEVFAREEHFGHYRPSRHRVSFPGGKNGGVGWASALVEAVEIESALTVIDCLLGIAELHLEPGNEDWDKVIQALDVANAWCPPRRQMNYAVTREMIRDDHLRPRVCLEIALSLTTYVAFRRRTVLAVLAEEEAGCAPQERLSYALSAAEASLQDHAWADAAHAIALATTLSLTFQNSESVRELTRSLCNLVDNVGQVSGSMVGIVEGLVKFKSELALVYCSLSEAGFHHEAFDVGLRMIGRLELELQQSPQRIQEFELLERHHRNPLASETSELFRQSELFKELERQILLEEAVPENTRGAISTPRVSVPRETMVLQLQPGVDSDSAVVVLAGVNDGHNTRYFSYGTTSPKEMVALADSLWITLGDEKSVLPELFDIFLAPAEEYLVGVRSIVIMADAGLPQLPFHAARDRSGYLIQKYRVTYCSLNNLRSGRTRTIAGDALVGGWHPELDGMKEALAVCAELGKTSLDVQLLPTAREGKQAILNGEPAALVHLVAHGELEEWPHASESRLELSPTVSVTAGEWMRGGRNISFVFVNACHAGNSPRTTGDRSGFPLAFSLSQARASVSALDFVPSDAGEQFAARFYKNFLAMDSLSAYQRACTDAIKNGATEPAWIPYIHQGMPVALRQQRN